ncbi:hypothetical protein FisN_6Lh453 [Fistulifera solaris]|uniref:C2 domain-containing protein n=1 Tax=Fistulifera solaris TaxID=1519565 RepID=A0A1Z5JSY8_FISSO|nr:hypothetical protein FisN_6Lh453 [Fistulifera solaris]|eukprot:GAX17153.1 hypothetical protein FisN_6Lh453 [Fistulifera solaris]
MPVTYQVPLEIKADSVKNIGETLVNTLKQPTNLKRALRKAPDALMKTPAAVVSKTSDALKKSADTFVQLHYFDYGWKSGPKSSIQKRTCSPEWSDEVLELQLGADSAEALLKSGERLELRLWSHDNVVGDSFLGSIQIPLLPKEKEKRATYRVLKRSPNDSSLQSHHATGELTAYVSLHAETMVDLHRGESFPLQQSKITLGVSCRKNCFESSMVVLDQEGFESSMVVLDREGTVMWDECAYHDHCVTDAISIAYNDSESKDLHYYHMDRCTIDVDLHNLPDKAVALFLVVYVPSEEAPLQLRILETESRTALARYLPHLVKASHTVILTRLARHSEGWFMAPIGESFVQIQDFGNLVPVIHSFAQDLITKHLCSHNISATAVLRRQRPMLLGNGNEEWKLRISWEEKQNDHTNMNFVTKALLLDGDYHTMDHVDANLQSSLRGGVVYIKGWRPKRFEKFEDFLVDKVEAINIHDVNNDTGDFTDEFALHLSKLSGRVRHVCFNILLAKKGEQAGRSSIEKVTLLVHDELSNTEFARFVSPVRNDSGLLVVCFSRCDMDSQEGDWVFEVAAMAAGPSDVGKQWKWFFGESGHTEPYALVPQQSANLDMLSREIPSFNVVNATPKILADETLLQYRI